MRKTLTAVAAVAMMATGVAVASSASAADEITLRESDVNLSQTRETGHNDFLRDGVHVYTEGATSTDKAAGYFEVGQPLASVTNASMDWRNTPGFTAIPGQQLVVDADGDLSTPDYNILVGEPVYGDDWWLTGGSSQAMKDGAPHNGGGSGSQWFGTLGEWSENFPDAVVTHGGWSLGSGVLGDGIVREMVLGDVTYTFTNKAAPLPTARPVASATIESPKRGVAKVHVTAEQPENTQPTERGAFYRVLRTERGAAADGEIEASEIVSYLAKGRVRDNGNDDWMRFEFNKPTKVTVVSYGETLSDKRIR